MKFIITDGASLKAGYLESCVKNTADYTVFVNGRHFDSAHAAEIMGLISAEKVLTPFEAGLSIHTAVTDAGRSAEENPCIKEMIILSGYGVSLQLKEEIKEFFSEKHLLSEKDLRFVTKKPADAPEKDRKKTGRREEPGKEETMPVSFPMPEPVTEADGDSVKESGGESISPFRKVMPEKPEKKTRRQDNRKKAPIPETESGKKKTEDSPEVKETKLPDFTGVTVKNDSGRITREAAEKILSFAGKYTPAAIAKASGLSKPTVYSIIRGGGKKEESTVKEMPLLSPDKDPDSGRQASVKNDKTDVRTDIKNEKADVKNKAEAEADSAVPSRYSPALMKKMKEAMVYDRSLPGIKGMLLNGRPLSGSILTDAANALGVELKGSDRLALVNAFYFLNVYEEDFIRNLSLSGFTMMKQVGRLKDVCECFLKIRKITLLDKQEKEHLLRNQSGKGKE